MNKEQYQKLCNKIMINEEILGVSRYDLMDLMIARTKYYDLIVGEEDPSCFCTFKLNNLLICFTGQLEQSIYINRHVYVSIIAEEIMEVGHYYSTDEDDIKLLKTLYEYKQKQVDDIINKFMES